MPTENLNRPVSFLAGETDDPDDDRTLGEVRSARRRYRRVLARVTRPKVGQSLQAFGAASLVVGIDLVAGLGTALIALGVMGSAVGVLMEMGRF